MAAKRQYVRRFARGELREKIAVELRKSGAMKYTALAKAIPGTKVNNITNCLTVGVEFERAGGGYWRLRKEFLAPTEEPASLPDLHKTKPLPWDAAYRSYVKQVRFEELPV